MSYNACMDTMTINISMPKGLYAQAKARAKKYHYASVSEVIRDALRWWMNDNLTRNGFTPQFEEETLKAAKEADAGNVIEWDGKESDLIKYVEGKKASKVRSKIRRSATKISRTRGRDRYTSVTV